MVSRWLDTTSSSLFIWYFDSWHRAFFTSLTPRTCTYTHLRFKHECTVEILRARTHAHTYGHIDAEFKSVELLNKVHVQRQQLKAHRFNVWHVMVVAIIASSSSETETVASNIGWVVCMGVCVWTSWNDDEWISNNWKSVRSNFSKFEFIKYMLHAILMYSIDGIKALKC